MERMFSIMNSNLWGLITQILLGGAKLHCHDAMKTNQDTDIVQYLVPNEQLQSTTGKLT